MLLLAACESREKKARKLEAELLASIVQEREKYEAVLEEMKATVGDADEFTLKREEFLSFFSMCLHDLPANAVFALACEDGGSHYLTDLTIQGVEKVWLYEEERTPKSLRLTTVLQDDGYLDIVLKLYDVPILDNENFGTKPNAEFVLLRDVFRFEWRLFDGKSGEWVHEWGERSQIPLRLELNALFSMRDEESIHYFAFSPALELKEPNL